MVWTLDKFVRACAAVTLLGAGAGLAALSGRAPPPRLILEAQASAPAAEVPPTPRAEIADASPPPILALPEPPRARGRRMAHARTRHETRARLASSRTP